MTVTVESFRQQYGEFFDESVYPAEAVTAWLNEAVTMLNPDRWAQALDIGTALYAAHYLTIGARNVAKAKRGGFPGVLKGPPSSQSVNGVAASYNSQSVLDPNAGQWNQTSYGSRFYQLMMNAGAGPVQIGAGLPIEDGGWYGWW